MSHRHSSFIIIVDRVEVFGETNESHIIPVSVRTVHTVPVCKRGGTVINRLFDYLEWNEDPMAPATDTWNHLEATDARVYSLFVQQ